MPELPSAVSVALPEQVADAFIAELTAVKDLHFEPAGAARGVSEASQLIIVATPSITTLLFVLERIRRLRLPRTYIRLTDGELDVWSDSAVSDGRIIVLGDQGRVSELNDHLLTSDEIVRLLGIGQPPNPDE